MVDRYVARGWVPVGGEREATPVPPTPPDPGPQPSRTDPASSDGFPPDEAPPGVMTLDRGSVPDGSARDVIDWVGDDRDRARAALDVEQAKGDDARTTLVAKLTKLAGR